MHPRLSVTGVVLAGGQSRRMGQNKADLLFRGQPLVSQMQQLLWDAGVDDCTVSGPRPADGWLADRQPGLGPLAGIDTALNTLACDAVLLVPVDMPLLTPRLLQTLLVHSAAIQAEACGYQYGPFPLWLRNTQAVRQALEHTLAEPEPRARSLKNFLSRLDFNLLDAPQHQHCFFNTNTPAQWQDCLSRAEEYSHGS